MGYGIKKIDGEIEAAKMAQEHIEGIIKAGEDHKAMQDQQYNNLGEEVTHQEELIAKLGKEKKHLFDCNQKTAEDATAIEDKCNLLAKLKSKLEAKLDELEDNLEREKKLRGDSEKAKRKAEGDLKLSQEAIGDLERNYKEYELVWERKEKEYAAIFAKIEDEGAIVYKDLTVKYDEVEAGSAKSGKKAVASLELKYNEPSKYAAAMKNVRKCERRIKELSFQYEEDRKNHDRMTDLVDKLQLKLKTYKKQIEEAEEVAALNLAKYR